MLSFFRNSRGYTLVELSVVMVIVSLLTAGGLTLGANMVNQAAHVDTGKILNQLNQSVKDYYVVTGKLPCPASLDLATNNSSFGDAINGGACNETDSIPAGSGTFYTSSVITGMIPSRTLGLSNKAASDKYGNRIIYSVTRHLTSTADFGSSNGAIRVNDAGGTGILSDAAYVIVSPGKDHNGARLYSSGASAGSCNTTGNLDGENCDFASNSVFRDAAYNNGDTASFFDDHIRWTPKYHLTAKTTQSSSLWSAKDAGADIYSVGTDGVTSTGNVGIGTENPQAKLDVDASGDGVAVLQLSTERPWVFEQAGTGGSADLRFRSTVGNKSFDITNSSNDPVASFYAATTASSSSIVFVPSGGKVGIGGAVGTDPLQVTGNITATGSLRTDGGTLYFNDVRLRRSNTRDLNYYSNNTASRINLYNSSNKLFGGLHGEGDSVGILDGDSNWAIMVDRDTSTSFRINNTERMVINSSKVLAKNDLEVNGHIYGRLDCDTYTGPNQKASSKASCPSNRFVISGGGDCTDGGTVGYLHESMPAGNGWRADCWRRDNNSSDTKVKAYAICCRINP